MDSRDECDVGSHGSRTGLLDPDVEAGRRDGERHRAIREQAAASTQSLADTLAGSAGRAPVGRVAGIDGCQDAAKSRWPGLLSRAAHWAADAEYAGPGSFRAGRRARGGRSGCSWRAHFGSK